MKKMKIFKFAIILFLLTLNFGSCKGKYTKDTVNIFITKDNFENIMLALELYKNEFGEYPNTLDELLQRKGITERSIIEDAWGRKYYYEKLKDSYKIFSLGPDGKPFTNDDIYPPKS